MKTLSAVASIAFCSLLFISTSALAGRHHSDHQYANRHDTASHQEYNKHRDAIYSKRGYSKHANKHQWNNAKLHGRNAYAYKHQQNSHAKHYWNKHANKHHASSNKYNKHYHNQRKYYDHDDGNRHNYKYSNHYYTARQVNHTLRRLSHYNPGLNLYFRF